MRSRVVTMFSIVLIVAFAVSISIAVAAQAPAGGAPAAGGQAPRGGGPGGGGVGGGAQRGGGGRGGPGMALTSTAWADGGEVPAKHAGGAGGQSISPALSWTNAPMGTAEFVLIMNDPEPVQGNSLRGDILHWLVAKIPAATTSFPENAGAMNSTLLPAGAVQVQVYRGPGAPAAGPRHHYTLTLYALNAPLDAAALTSRATVEAAMEGKVLSRAIFGGRFMQAPAP